MNGGVEPRHLQYDSGYNALACMIEAGDTKLPPAGAPAHAQVDFHARPRSMRRRAAQRGHAITCSALMPYIRSPQAEQRREQRDGRHGFAGRRRSARLEVAITYAERNTVGSCVANFSASGTPLVKT